MITALRTAASGLLAESAKQDIIANNIANAQTAGFKRVRTATTSFAEALQQALPISSVDLMPPYPSSPTSATTASAEEAVDSSQGVIQSTGNDLDFAIDGPGWFEISSRTGTQQTRAGNFRLGPDGELMTADGAFVQGQSGTIRVPNGRMEVSDDGVILVNGAEVDKIKIVGEQPDTTRVLQGHLENANVSVITEMVAMITNMRSFEANQKTIWAVDHTLDKLINEAGKV
jgi:flagellar basal-body rod protein FlgF